MVRRIPYLMAVVAVVTLGAIQRPANAGSRDTRNNVSEVSVAKAAHSKPYQVGTASWYGDYFDGKETASGEPFNMYDLTAAHPSLPLGTLVKVTNLTNRKAIVVRINDRGPVVPGRIIDLSYGAAQELHFKNRGIQKVRLDVVHPQMIAALSPPER